MEEEWTQISVSFFWPYEAMLVGYEMVEPDETQHWYSFMLHCFFCTFRYEWGYGDRPYS